jgi:hypothetical protein
VISSLSITAIMPPDRHPGHPDFSPTAAPGLALGGSTWMAETPQMAQKRCHPVEPEVPDLDPADRQPSTWDPG